MADLYKMLAAGVLREGDRVELHLLNRLFDSMCAMLCKSGIVLMRPAP